MKILQVVHSLPDLNQAGTEIYTFSLARELSNKHGSIIFSRYSKLDDADYSLKKESFSGITAYLVNNTFRDCFSFEGLYQNNNIDEKFAQALEEIKPDLVHIQHLVFLSLGIIKKAKEKNIPVVFTLHDYWLFCPKWHLLKNDHVPCDKAAPGLFDAECGDCLRDMLKVSPPAVRAYYLARKMLPGPIIKYLRKVCSGFNRGHPGKAIEQLRERRARIREVLKQVDFFLAPSSHVKARFEASGIDPEKIILHRQGLTELKKQEGQAEAGKKIRFAFIGTIVPAKGLHILLKAFNAVKGSGASLKIYGKLKDYPGFEGYLGSIKQAARNKGIEFMGEFRHDEMKDILDSVDALVVPSVWQENSPLVVREAFAAGVPVIASRIGGIPEDVRDGVSGMLFAPGNIDELRQRMQSILDDPVILNRLKNNIPPVKSLAEEVNELEAIYNRVMSA